MRLSRCGFTLVMLGLGLPVLAQEQRASIEGVARDSQGGVVPGVVVQARNTAGLALETTTDGTGTYRFASLPPGRYEVVARLSGFAPARVVDVELKLGVELRVDLKLEPSSVTETIEVVSQSPLVAITQSSRATSLRDEEIEKMPKGRDFTTLVSQAAGVNAQRKSGTSVLLGSEGISIDGASGAENRVIVNGVESADSWKGSPGLVVATDFVDEVQVKSSGYSAEHGGSTGGVINAITKTGTNAWHGDALLYWSGDALDAGPRASLRLDPLDPTRAEHVTYPEDSYRQLEPGFTIGGPLVRDRLWLFAGYVPSFRPLDRTVSFLSDGSTATFRQEFRRHHATVNLTAQLGPRWRAKAAFTLGRGRSSSVSSRRWTAPSSPTADWSIDSFYPAYTVSASVDFTAGRRAMLSLRAGYFFNDL